MKLNLTWLAAGIICLAKLFAPTSAAAQGTVYFSNLGQPAAGTNVVGYNNLAIDIQFLTGTNAGGYSLNSIQLLMMNAIGSGSLGGFSVSVYPLAQSPGSSSYSLFGYSDPRAAGIYTYSPISSVSLLPDTVYGIEISSFGQNQGDDYCWSYAGTAAATASSDGWNQLGVSFYSGQGASGFPQFAIYATPTSPVPEPDVRSLAASGLLMLLAVKFHRASLVKRKTAPVSPLI